MKRIKFIAISLAILSVVLVSCSNPSGGSGSSSNGNGANGDSGGLSSNKFTNAELDGTVWHGYLKGDVTVTVSGDKITAVVKDIGTFEYMLKDSMIIENIEKLDSSKSICFFT